MHYLLFIALGVIAGAGIFQGVRTLRRPRVTVTVLTPKQPAELEYKLSANRPGPANPTMVIEQFPVVPGTSRTDTVAMTAIKPEDYPWTH